MKRFCFVLFFIFFVLTSFAQKKYEKSFNKDCIPKNLKDTTYTLLIISPYKENEKNEEIKAIFDSLYKGKFSISCPECSTNPPTPLDINKYRYGLTILEKYEKDMFNDINRKYYDVSIIDYQKLFGKIDQKILKQKMEVEGKKSMQKLIESLLQSGQLDIEALKETGLQEHHSKVKAMFIFLATKLGEAN